MYLGPDEMLTGDELLDAVRGAQEVVSSVPNVDEKVARLTRVLSLLPLQQLSSQAFEINARRAFIRSDDLAPNRREYLENVQFFGFTGVAGQMFRYLYAEDEPVVDDLGLNIFGPVLVGFNVREKYGIETFSLQVPVRDIDLAQRIVAA